MTATYIETTVTILNRRGLHARAAARFVRTVEGADCEIVVIKDQAEVCGTSIMGLLMLGAGKDSQITLRASGPEGQKILQELVDLIARRFDEE